MFNFRLFASFDDCKCCHSVIASKTRRGNPLLRAWVFCGLPRRAKALLAMTSLYKYPLAIPSLRVKRGNPLLGVWVFHGLPRRVKALLAMTSLTTADRFLADFFADYRVGLKTPAMTSLYKYRLPFGHRE